MRNKKIKLISVIFIIVILFSMLSQSFAADILDNLDNIDRSDLARSDILDNLEGLENLEDIDITSANLDNLVSNAMKDKTITPAEVTDIYNELSKTYSNKELGQMIKDNSSEISKQTGIDNGTISMAGTMLQTMNKDQVKKAIDTYTEKVISNPEEGLDAITSTGIITMVTSSFGLILDILLSSTLVKVILIALIVLFIYRTVLFWIIYRKAGRHGFATLIPLYRQITYLKVCDITPLYISFIIIPVVGWFALFILGIVCRFKLAKGFGKGAGFGFGLLFFNTIFLSILAFSGNTKYIGFNNDEEYENNDKEIEVKKIDKKEKKEIKKDENSDKENKDSEKKDK